MERKQTYTLLIVLIFFALGFSLFFLSGLIEKLGYWVFDFSKGNLINNEIKLSPSLAVIGGCGDGTLNLPAEQCDDGNNSDSDGCTSSCQIEKGWQCQNQPSYCSWIPPIGIPKPNFGIQETNLMYSGKRFDFDGDGLLEPGEEYKDSGNGPYTHYVDNTPACSDLQNFGTPQNPRCAIPNNLSPGSVVEVHGGPYIITTATTAIVADGSPDAPIFIRGPNSSVKPIVKSDAGINRFVLMGQYFVVENFTFQTFNVHFRSSNQSSTFQGALRHSEIVGDSNPYNGTAVSVAGSAGLPISGIVIYDNNIHHNGKWDNPQQNDYAGTHVGVWAERVWIVDNNIHHNGGDAFIIGNESEPSFSHHIYVGRNIMHTDRENAADIKQASDIIISENLMYDYRYQPSTSITATAIVMQHNPERVWVLFNEIHSATIGVLASASKDIYIIGNVIHSIRETPDEQQGENSVYRTGGAIQTRAANSVWAIQNTIFDVEVGISLLVRGESNFGKIVNNIISDVVSVNSKGRHGRHILVGGDVNPLNNSEMKNNLLFQGQGPIQIYWAKLYQSLSDFSQATGKGEGSLTADPLFINSASRDFRLQEASPGLDRGIASEVFQKYLNLYGVDIRQDRDRRARPQGIGWDIGAYESQAQAQIQDQDRDGVQDFQDRCSNTLAGAAVNVYGCPKPIAAEFTSDLTSDFNREDLLAITDLKIGVTSFAQIMFPGSTNLLRFNDSAGRYERVDLDSYINILPGKVWVDASNLPMLNKTARISLFNVNLTNPFVKKDGQTCPEPQCRIISYDRTAKILVIEVQGF